MVEKIEWSEFLRGNLIHYYHTFAPTANAVTNLLSAGEHPAMRFIKGTVIARVHDTTAPQMNIEDGDGNTITATATASTTVHTAVSFTAGTDLVIYSQEALKVEVTTAGGANAMVDLNLTFEIYDE